MAEAQQQSQRITITAADDRPDGPYLTLTQFKALMGRPVEVVAGEVIETMPHTRQQPRIVFLLMSSLLNFVVENKLGELYPEATYVLDGSRRSDWVRGSRTPDLSFISQARIDAHNAAYPDPDEPWWLAPDLAVEVVSPTDDFIAVQQKIADYLAAGAHIVWIVEPRAHAMRVYTPTQPTGITLAPGDVLTAEPLFPGWALPVETLFPAQEAAE